MLSHLLPRGIMPITPHFTIDQSETHVTIEIAVPHIRVTDVQTVLTDDDTVFHFASSPAIYLLVLSFAPHQFLPDSADTCRAQFDPILRNGTIRLELQKKDIGYWDKLDLIGKLQSPSTSLRNANNKTKRNGSWLVAVENSSGNEDVTVDSVDGLYGFARMFQGVFTDLIRDGLAREMLEMPWNENNHHCTIITNREEITRVHLERRLERIQMEQQKFCPDRFLGDTFGCNDDYLYQSAMAMQPHWWTLQDLPYDREDCSLMLSIPYPLLPKDLKHDQLLLPLLDILFAYVYDHLLTDGDPTVESAWTISTLSSTLGTLEDWSDNADTRLVVESCIRRSLIYPYLRTYDFALYVLDQVSRILRKGLRTVVRSFLHIRRILDRSELYYLGNKVFIDPFLAWLQKCDINFDERMMKLAYEIEQISQSSELKESIGLGLASIENVAATSTCASDDEDVSSSSSGTGTATLDGEVSTADEVTVVTELTNLRIG